MNAILTIEGMACNHCEEHVKKALSALKGVKSVKVSHISGKAELVLKAPVSESDLRSAVEDAGYSLKGVEFSE